MRDHVIVVEPYVDGLLVNNAVKDISKAWRGVFKPGMLRKGVDYAMDSAEMSRLIGKVRSGGHRKVAEELTFMVRYINRLTLTKQDPKITYRLLVL